MNERELFLVSLTYDRSPLTQRDGSDWHTIEVYIAISMESVEGHFWRMFFVAAKEAVHKVIGPDVSCGEGPWFATVNNVKHLGTVGLP